MRSFSPFLVSCVVLVATPAWAENPGPAAQEPPGLKVLSAPGTDAPRAERVAYWRTRGDLARKRVAEAEAELNEANAAVSRMRRRNHPRGEPRAELFATRDAARDRLADAVHHLEVELPREASRADAVPEWLGR